MTWTPSAGGAPPQAYTLPCTPHKAATCLSSLYDTWCAPPAYGPIRHFHNHSLPLSLDGPGKPASTHRVCRLAVESAVSSSMFSLKASSCRQGDATDEPSYSSLDWHAGEGLVAAGDSQGFRIWHTADRPSTRGDGAEASKTRGNRLAPCLFSVAHVGEEVSASLLVSRYICRLEYQG